MGKLTRERAFQLALLLFFACSAAVVGWRFLMTGPRGAGRFPDLVYSELALPGGEKSDDTRYFSSWVSRGDGRVAVVVGNFFGSRIYWSRQLPQSSDDYESLIEIGPKVCVVTCFAWDPNDTERFAFILRELELELPAKEELLSTLADVEKKDGSPGLEAYVKKLFEKSQSGQFQEVLYTAAVGDASPTRVATLQEAAKMAPQYFNTANMGPFFHCLTWASDSSFLVYRNGRTIYRVGADGSRHEPVYPFPEGIKIASAIEPLPDNRFCIVTKKSRSLDGRTVTFDAEGATVETVPFPSVRQCVDIFRGKTRWVSFKGFDSGLVMQVVSTDRPDEIVRYMVNPDFSSKSVFTIVGLTPDDRNVLLTRRPPNLGSEKRPSKASKEEGELVVVHLDLEDA